MATKPIRSKKASRKKRPQRKTVPIEECLAALRRTNPLVDGEELYGLKKVAAALAQLRGVSEVEVDAVMRFLKYYFHAAPEGSINRRWSQFQLSYGLPASNVDDLIDTGIPWREAAMTINSFPDWYAAEVSNTRTNAGKAGGRVSVEKKNAEAAAEIAKKECAESGGKKSNRPVRVGQSSKATNKNKRPFPLEKIKSLAATEMEDGVQKIDKKLLTHFKAGVRQKVRVCLEGIRFCLDLSCP